MGWTRPSGHIIRAFATVLLFVGPQCFRRNRCELGAFLLQLCATRNHGRPMFYAGHPIACALHHRFVFLPTLDRGVRAGIACKIDVIFCSRDRDFAVDFNQTAEHFNRCAARVPGISAFQYTATPARSSISKSFPVVLWRACTFAIRALVRACLPNRVAILSASLFWSRGSSNHVRGVVSENREGNRDLDAHAFCFCSGWCRRAGHKNLP